VPPKTDAEMLLELVPEDGSSIGNTALLNRLGWSEMRFWSVRKALIETGDIEPWRGRGGSLRRTGGGAGRVPARKAKVEA